MVSRLLGEEVAPDEVAPEAIPAQETPAADTTDYSNPSVDRLVELWQSGDHEAVGLRVLDALDHYEDFMELAFRIGHEGALELGRIMDAFTSTEKSPHKYDKLTDQDMPSKMGKQPRPAEVSGAIGAGE